MSKRPRLFLGYASETTGLAEELGKALEPHVDVRDWRHHFGLGEFNLQALQREAAASDFAVFIWGKEDATIARFDIESSPRDNVVYEAGLFAGALGEHRVFVAHAKGTRIPSDYLGVTTVSFPADNPDAGHIAQRIRDSVEHLGLKPAMRMRGYWWQLVGTVDDRSVVSFLEVRPQTAGRSVTMGGHAWDRRGHLVARWDTIATQFDERTETLHYSWEGTHTRAEGVPIYFGVGTVRYGLSPIIGDFSTTRRHQGDRPERTRFKSAFYFPAEDGDIPVMSGRERKLRRRLVARMLKLRGSFD